MEITPKSQLPGNLELKPSLLHVPAFIVCVPACSRLSIVKRPSEKQTFPPPPLKPSPWYCKISYFRELEPLSGIAILQGMLFKEGILIPFCSADNLQFHLIWLTGPHRPFMPSLYFADVYFKVWKRRMRGELLVLYNCLKGGCSKVSVGLFPLVTSDIT